MSIKGSAVKATKEYVLKKHPDRYEEWLKKLSPQARNIISNPILATQWYPIEESVVEPTTTACDLFFDKLENAAWQMGEFSADQALSGIYKVFVLISTPQFIISRGAKVFQSYYKDSEIIIKDKSEEHVRLQIVKFPYPHEVMECRIAGWISGAIQKTGHKKIDVKITKSMTKGDPYTEIYSKWSK